MFVLQQVLLRGLLKLLYKCLLVVLVWEMHLVKTVLHQLQIFKLFSNKIQHHSMPEELDCSLDLNSST